MNLLARLTASFFALFLIVTGPCALADESALPGKDTVVVVEGTSVFVGNEVGPARHAALADALRRAIEKASGVTVLAETKTSNFTLSQDSVTTSCDGFVKGYRILEEGANGGTYRVKIQATVAPGSPIRPLDLLCKALREGGNPAFKISVEGRPGRTISADVAHLGLKVANSGASGIEFRGKIQTDSRGESLSGSGIFSSSASTDIEVVDSVSGNVLPSVNVVLSQPIASTGQQQADLLAEETAARLWVRRNIPLIAAAILGPDRFKIEGAGKLPDTPTSYDAVEQETTLNPPSPGDIAGELAWKLSNEVRRTHAFAVMPITVAISRFKGINLADESATENLQEDLETSMAKTGVFELVERSELDQVLKELKVQNSGLIDSATAKRLGKLTGASAILVGSISDRKDAVVINARLINTENGRVRVAESVVIEKDAEPVVLEANPNR